MSTSYEFGRIFDLNFFFFEREVKGEEVVYLFLSLPRVLHIFNSSINST